MFYKLSILYSPVGRNTIITSRPSCHTCIFNERTRRNNTTNNGHDISSVTTNLNLV